MKINSVNELHEFLTTYFIAQHCPIIDNQNGVLTVKLTEVMDRALMNRPFYWHYIKGTGNQGEPMQLSFITNPDNRDKEGEWIHFGSPRLQQIIQHLKQNQKFIKVFQQISVTHNTPLYPWLLTNIKVRYEGKQNKDELFSIGLHLVNGTMKTDMMHLVQPIQFNNTIADYCYPISPLIKLHSGFSRIETVIDRYIHDQEHHWAEEAMDTLREEIDMVRHFYIDKEDKTELDKEIDELTTRYTPAISYEVINGGLLYLAENTI